MMTPLREVHNRGMNTITDRYKLPADQEEMERLTLQHRMWRLLVGGLYPSSLNPFVEEVLDKTDNKERCILDLGTGSGIWAAEMAEAFPAVEVVGIDLAQNYLNLPSLPPNLRYFQADVTLGLPEFEGKADLIHARSLIGHLKDPAVLMDVITKSLRPGGLLILADGDLKAFNERKEILSPVQPHVSAASEIAHTTNANTSWWAGYGQLWGEISRSSTNELLPNHEHISKDTRYKFLEEKSFFCPMKWPGEGIENGDELGEMSFRNFKRFLQATKPSVLRSGRYSSQEIDEWIKKIEQEVGERRTYGIWHVAAGYKC